jgi:hypothetical protein
MKYILSLTLVLFINYFGYCQNEEIEKEFEYAKEPVEIDTTDNNVFEGFPDVKFKLDYYHTDGYSTGDRYWYEIIIADSLLIFNFKSPNNDDWNYISYQKQIIIDLDSLMNVINFINDAKISQKVKGMPIPVGSGYGGDRLYIEGNELNIAGGTVYMNVGLDMSEDLWKKKIKIEKETSSTINGDFQKVFNYLEKLFIDLPMLLESKNK